MTPAIREAAWPGFLTARDANLRSAVAGLEQSQHWSSQEILDGQRRQLTWLLQLSAKNVPWYGQAEWTRPFLAEVAVRPAAFWELWQGIPLLTKPQLREHGALLNARSLPAAQLPLGSAKTSGSVGIPVEVRTTVTSRLAWNALTVREHLWRQRDFGKRLGVIRSNPKLARSLGGAGQPDWGPPVADLHTTGPSSVMHIGLPLENHVAWLKRFDPHYLLTYPSLVAELLEQLGAGGRPPSLEEVRMLSEPVDSSLEDRLRDIWQVQVADIYSANEVGNIAFRCRHQRLHVQSEAVLVEILDDEGRACAGGETGRVVVTGLQNIATPLLRYDIGDYATVGAPCPCGRAHPVLEKVLGRVRNLARTPDGGKFWPAALVRIRAVSAVRQFQYVQTAPDRIELRVVLDRDLTAGETGRLQDLVRQTLKYPYQVDVTPVAAIERGPTGKFEEFRSEIP